MHLRHGRLVAVAAERHSHAWPVAATKRFDDFFGNADTRSRLAVELKNRVELHRQPLS